MAGERRGKVVVTADRPDGRWQLTVADDGPGVPPEKVETIFEPLFTTKTKGTGLGLAIVASIVKRHDGDIRVESVPGEGARFVIEWNAGLRAAAAEGSN
jgi:two-component system, NtrC family, sensor histidine kinase HydH